MAFEIAHETMEAFIYDVQFLAIRTLCEQYLLQKHNNVVKYKSSFIFDFNYAFLSDNVFPTNFDEYSKLFTFVRNSFEDKSYEILRLCVQIFENLKKMLTNHLKNNRDLGLLKYLSANIRTDLKFFS